MAQLPNIKVPDIDTGQLNNTKYAKQILNYLMSLDESLRYMFGNLDDENLTSKFIKDLTVGNLLITNGENSIIGNPLDGFVFMKGTKPVIKLDILTGNGEFRGDIIGSILKSNNFDEDESGVISGMKIDLDKSVIKSKFLTLDDEGAVFKGDIEGANITGSTMETRYGAAPGEVGEYIILRFDYTSITAWLNEHLSDGTEMAKQGAEITWQGVRCQSGMKEMFVDPDGETLSNGLEKIYVVNAIEFKYKGNNVITEGNKDNYTFKTSGYTGSFMTATGKTATVVNGLITSIV